MPSAWENLYGETREERAQNMAGSTWQLPERLKDRPLPLTLEGQHETVRPVVGALTRRRRAQNTRNVVWKSTFDNNNHRFFEDISSADKGRKFLICVSQRFELNKDAIPNYYKLFLTDSVEELIRSPDSVTVTECECEDYKYRKENNDYSDCKHMLLFKILKENLIVEPPEPIPEPIAEPIPEPIPEQIDEPIADPEPRRRQKQKKKVPRALAGLTTTLKQTGIPKRRRGRRRNVKR